MNGDVWGKIQKGVFVIAEIGKGFIQSEDERPVSEYLENAKKLAKAAKEAGADAAKFQTHTVEDEQLNISVVSPHFKGTDRYSWVVRNTNATPLEDFWKPLKQYCDDIGIIFFSAPMSRGAARLLQAVDMQLWKIGSGDILDFVMLEYIASTGKPVIISSGMSTEAEVDLAMDFLKKRNVRFALLHCVSKYPCPPEDLHLASIDYLSRRYGVPTGFSDHSIGIDSALAAVALGAKIIEKHFSFDRALWGSDHKVSLLPYELKALVVGIRDIETNSATKNEYLEKDIVKAGMGTPQKTMESGEEVFRPYFRKSLMAGMDIPAGTELRAEMIFAMRPQMYAGGMPSEEYPNAIGKITLKNLKKYEPITEDVLNDMAGDK